MRTARGLFIHRLLMRAALAFGNLFSWIFVFEFFYLYSYSLPIALSRVALLYALAQVVSSLLIPLSARYLGNGMRREMVFGAISCASALIFLGALFQGVLGPLYGIGIALFAIFFGFYRAFYWVPYGIESEQFKNTASLPGEILVALMPALAGVLFILRNDSETLTLFLAALLVVFSLIPLIFVPETYERFGITYRDAFAALFIRGQRGVVWSAFVDGVQGAALLIFWPLAIFIVVGGSYAMLGIIFSITCLILIAIRLLLDRTHSQFLIKVSLPVRIAIVSSAWIARPVVGSPATAVLADSYLHLGNAHYSVDHPAFEQSADLGHYIDEVTVMREIGLAFGRIALCICVVILSALFSIPVVFGVVFLLAGMSAGLSVLLSHTSRRSI